MLSSNSTFDTFFPIIALMSSIHPGPSLSLELLLIVGLFISDASFYPKSQIMLYFKTRPDGHSPHVASGKCVGQ
jgi:hypothetical protein